MTDYEPYLDDPAEPPPAVVLERFRGSTAFALVIILAAALTFMVIAGRSQEDPSLNVPLDQFAPQTPVEGTPPADPPADPPAEEAPAP